MIKSVFTFGNLVLRKKSVEISKDYPNLQMLIDDMFETMYKAEGVGLAAPQIGENIRLFVIDASPMAEDDPSLVDFKKVFINPVIIEERGEEWVFNEGCLSLPSIREDVKRKSEVLLKYYNENFELKEELFTGIGARVIQHEYDHLEGILFVDRISALKKRLLKNKLGNIEKGKVDVNYKVKFSIK